MKKLYKINASCLVLLAFLFSCSTSQYSYTKDIQVEAITLHVEEVNSTVRVGHAPGYATLLVGSNNVPYYVISKDSLLDRWVLTASLPTRISLLRRPRLQTRISSLWVTGWEPIKEDEMVIKFVSTEGLSCYLYTVASDTLVYGVGYRFPFLRQ